MFRPTRVLIDLAALKQNALTLKQWTGGAFYCPMVKANAYGHDEVLVSRALESAGVDALGVALVEEGVRLRQAGVHAPILVFAPFTDEGARAMQEHALTPVAGRFADLDALAALGAGTLPIHLKFNTGMQRLGFTSADLPRLRARVNEISALRVAGVCTHLTHGEEAFDPSGVTARQLSDFLALTREFPGVRHAHKTASLAALQEKAAGLGARPGIGIYGLPHEGRATAPGLRPVLSWTTELVGVRDVDKGAAVGYSSRWTAQRPSTIGVLPVGYADGFRRNLSNNGEMLFRGRRVPVIGGICMDYCFVDLTDACAEGKPRAGETVVILGRQGDAEIVAADIAERLGTIAYEVVTAISRRVPREAVEQSL